MKPSQFRKMLERELGYRLVPGGKGSHEKLEAEGRPNILLGFGGRTELSPIEVRNILVKQVGLTLDEARKVAERG